MYCSRRFFTAFEGVRPSARTEARAAATACLRCLAIIGLITLNYSKIEVNKQLVKRYQHPDEVIVVGFASGFTEDGADGWGV